MPPYHVPPMWDVILGMVYGIGTATWNWGVTQIHQTRSWGLFISSLLRPEKCTVSDYATIRCSTNWIRWIPVAFGWFLAVNLHGSWPIQKLSEVSFIFPADLDMFRKDGGLFWRIVSPRLRNLRLSNYHWRQYLLKIISPIFGWCENLGYLLYLQYCQPSLGWWF